MRKIAYARRFTNNYCCPTCMQLSTAFARGHNLRFWYSLPCGHINKAGSLVRLTRAEVALALLMVK